VEIVLISVFALLFLGLVLSDRRDNRKEIEKVRQEALIAIHQSEVHSSKLYELACKYSDTPEELLYAAADLSKRSREATKKWRTKRWV
jgi:hypothetical protein